MCEEMAKSSVEVIRCPTSDVAALVNEGDDRSGRARLAIVRKESLASRFKARFNRGVGRRCFNWGTKIQEVALWGGATLVFEVSREATQGNVPPESTKGRSFGLDGAIYLQSLCNRVRSTGLDHYWDQNSPGSLGPHRRNLSNNPV
jgi:hypothetical protein